METHESTKLFYDKFLYRLTFTNILATIFRNKNLYHARQRLDELQYAADNDQPLFMRSFLREVPIKVQSLNDAKIVYSHLSTRSDYILRIQHPRISLYSNDKKWLLDLREKLEINSEKECTFSGPSDECIPLLQNSNHVIVVSTPPEFKYKVTLGIQTNNEFVNWIKDNPDKVKAGKIFLDASKNFGGTGMYFYARDKKILQLITLMGINIRRIDKLICKQDLDK